MLKITRVIAVALLAIAVGLLFAMSAKTTTLASAAVARKAVIVELFTSEGCSSCPPADSLLGELRHAPANGVEIIPLGFHVDYWNYLGWQDRFSSPEYSRRQEDYARHFRINGPYTPQMVVDGAEEFVGGAERRATAAIAHAATQPAAAEVQLDWAVPEKLEVRVSAPGLTTGDVLLAVTEDNLSTQVAAGENHGRVLRHSAVVRDFRHLGQVKNGAFSAGVPVKFQKDWKRSDLRVVVFVQAPDEGRIEGAAALALK